jgi:hypothetical protein
MVDVVTEIDITGPVDAVSPFMAAAMRRANRTDLARLKDILERA